MDVAGQAAALASTVNALSEAGIIVSLFVEAEERQLDAAAELQVPYVELHTGSFCDAGGGAAERELGQLIRGAEYAHDLGLKVNAGHGISMETISDILKMPYLDTLNIGHSIVARAVFLGLEGAVREMLEGMKNG